MVNWKDIDINFTEELQEEWESKGFSCEETKEWTDIGLTVNDAEYAYWLKDIKKFDSDWVHNYGNDEELRKQYQEYSISRWRSKKFTDEEIKAWKKVGLRPQDGGYAAWMRDITKITPEEYLYCLEGDSDRLLREQHQKFLEERKVRSTSQSGSNYLARESLATRNLGANAQEWLDNEYPKEERNKIKELDISKEITGETLEGSLKLEGFVNLRKLDCSDQMLTNLDLTSCSNLQELDCSSCQLTELDLHNCPNLEELYCSFNELSKLKVGCCPNLRELVCDGNKFSELNLRKNKRIKKIACRFNSSLIGANLSNCRELKEFLCVGTSLIIVDLANCDKLEKFSCFFSPLPNLNFFNGLPFPENLKIIELNNSGFSPQDLSCFAKFINLEELSISNNHFRGSLEHLSNLTKLKSLNISNTDIDSGLEYLPENLEEIYCNNCQGLIDQLGDCKKDSSGRYHYQDWRKDHPELIKKAQAEKESLLSLGVLSIASTKDQTLQQKNTLKPSLERLIGRGGYGEVYYGKWKLQDVAVKKLYLSLPNTSEFDIKDIKEEINILKNLRNKHIIQYYDTYSDDQELLIIMDYAENGTLTKFINDNKDEEHNWDLNNEFIQQMTLGLAYIHHQGIIHRDLKSMNILLDKHFQIKISDFGLSKTKNISSSYSKHGDIVGTLRWMAPELLSNPNNSGYSEQSDIYALGMIIWEIAAKCTIPFKDIGYNLIGFHIINNGKETIPADTPQNIQYLIQQCWLVNPPARIALEKILLIIKNNDQPDNHKSTGLTKEFKRKVSLSAENFASKKSKLANQTKPMDCDQEWVNIHPSFTLQLVQSWQNQGFSYSEVYDWIRISSPTNQAQAIREPEFYTWLRDIKQVDSDWVYNYGNLTQLKQEYQTYQQQAQIEILPKQ